MGCGRQPAIDNGTMLNRSLRFKINAAIIATCAIIVVIFWALLYPFEMNRRNARLEEIEVLLDTVFQQKRDELANEVFADQRPALERTLEEMQRVKGIALLTVFDLEGNPILSTGRSIPEPLAPQQRGEVYDGPVFERRNGQGGSYVEYTTLIQVIGEKTGYLRMHYNLADMERESTVTLAFFVGLLLSTLVIISLFLNVFLSRSVIRPASLLRDGIRKVHGGHLGEQVALPTSDEIGEMAADFNDMSTRLKEQHIALTDAIQAKDAYASRLEATNRELETLNTRLEDMVEARTAELRASNEQLQQEIDERKQAEKDKRDLEEKLARSQKMEALGLLAGGVAHDLNNVLSGIVSYPDLLLLELPERSPLREPILTIQNSGQKAAAIVQDLLTLARRGVTSTEVLNLNDVVADYLASPEYARLATYHPGVRIGTDLCPDLLNVQGSPVHLRKTLMNLVSNAAEAQPEGGSVRIYTVNRYVDRPIRGYQDVREGEYAVLGVADDGAGIAREDLDRIFEPFYTKKVMGRSGTGLGMAVVWGTVQDHRGYIDLTSSEGRGTTFELYFPITRETEVNPRVRLPMKDFMGEGQVVLVVDDVEEQREIATRMLQRLNYEVVTASSGEDAVAYVRENRADVLVLDMIMDPGMDGLDTYRAIRRLHPGQKAVIASGFAENERVRGAQRLGAGEYVKKPYTLESIGVALKRTLHARPDERGNRRQG
jgi:signal transduction histidine kinase/ActR/RegA family two-component response regulator